ncbi:MAG: hypothetical protein GY754_10530 [bacterium]|nr:hypothetical protein [bacterium]
MEKATIWYLTDNGSGEKIAASIRELGLTTNVISEQELKASNILENEINLFVFDLAEKTPEKTVSLILGDQRLQSYLKFVVLKKKEIKDASKLSYNTLHLEFIGRPIDKREFLLLVEKSIIVERYREIMTYISRESESRVQLFEGLMDINRKNIFESEREEAGFKSIIAYEKKLLKEQDRLNKAISNFSLLRQSEMFDMKKRANSEEILLNIKQRELVDAHSVIDAQASVLEFSAHELNNAKSVINATETVAELGRTEAIDLHDELKREKLLNRSLAEEIDRLLRENEALKK